MLEKSLLGLGEIKAKEESKLAAVWLRGYSKTLKQIVAIIVAQNQF